jgi:undecaprenyl-diphosphatase
MTIGEALFLGALQGITEFLPVSSSGHLVLFQKIFRISEQTLPFDTLLHAGTLLAVVVVLRRDIRALLRRPFQPLTLHLIIATCPVVIVALLFNDAVEAAFQSGALLGGAFLFTAAALTTAEFLSRRRGTRRYEKNMTAFDALIIGIAQSVAILPAVSRSGLTLSGALSRKLERGFAARFSFLLSIPVILGALVFQLKDLADGSVQAVDILNLPALLGALSAAIVGFFSVRFMLNIVRRHSLLGFAVYTALLGFLVLLDQNVSHIVF